MEKRFCKLSEFGECNEVLDPEWPSNWLYCCLKHEQRHDNLRKRMRGHNVYKYLVSKAVSPYQKAQLLKRYRAGEFATDELIDRRSYRTKCQDEDTGRFISC